MISQSELSAWSSNVPLVTSLLSVCMTLEKGGNIYGLTIPVLDDSSQTTMRRFIHKIGASVRLCLIKKVFMRSLSRSIIGRLALCNFQAD